jgi:dipeptidyl aminopeptidase/acylaminoacyl peptidase
MRKLASVVLFVWVVLFGLPCVPPSGLAATAARPLPEDVAALSAASDLHISPDGSQLVYALSTHRLDPQAKPSASDHGAGWIDDRQLFVIPVRGGERVQLTRGAERASAPRWSPDGREIAFLRKQDGKTRLHRIPVDGGEAVVVPTGELEPTSILWSPDGRQIAFTAAVPETQEQQDAKWRTGDVEAFGEGWRPSALWVVTRTGGEPRRVTRGDEHVAQAAWSPDGTRFLIATSRSADPYEVTSRLTPKIVAARNGAVLRVLEREPRGLDDCRWSPDGRLVAYLTGENTLSLLNVLRVREADGPGVWNAASTLDPTLAGYVWASDSRSLVAHVAERTGSHLYRLPAHGGAHEDLGFADRVIDAGLDASRDGGTLAFLSSTDREPWDPTVLEPGHGNARVVVRLNPQVADWDLGRTEIVRWRNPEGVELEGLLLVTPHARPGAPPPLLVYPHGGPDDVSQAGFSGRAHFFAARGYSVFRPNYRGGTGYGHAFYAANRGRLGEIEWMDIESGVDHLIAAGKADPKRLLFGGWSWGGYLTDWAIGHSDRYRAAVSGAGVADVVNQYVLSDINHGVAAEWEYRGNPWRQTANFDHADPIRCLANARTPTLILHGEADDRVPFGQSVTLYRALHDVGCPVKFYAYPREPHGFVEPAHVAHVLRVWADWYDAHLSPAGRAGAKGR